MSEFFYLIPISLLLGAGGLVVFLWSLRAKQYDDLDGAAARILFEEDAPIRDAREKAQGQTANSDAADAPSPPSPPAPPRAG